MAVMLPFKHGMVTSKLIAPGAIRWTEAFLLFYSNVSHRIGPEA